MKEVPVSVSDLLSLADDKLRDVFNLKPRDPAKDRAKAIKLIDQKRRQKERNDIVEYTSPWPIEGRSTHYVPAERFSDFVEKLKNLVTEGHFDTDIERAQASGSGAFVAENRSSYTAEPRKKRAPMTEEAKAAMKAKREATMKARGTKPGRQKA